MDGRPVPDCLVRENIVYDDIAGRQRRKLKDLRQSATHVGVCGTSTTGAPPNPYPLDHDHHRRMPGPGFQSEANSCRRPVRQSLTRRQTQGREVRTVGDNPAFSDRGGMGSFAADPLGSRRQPLPRIPGAAREHVEARQRPAPTTASTIGRNCIGRSGTSRAAQCHPVPQESGVKRSRAVLDLSKTGP
jgi:hypothetical protein